MKTVKAIIIDSTKKEIREEQISTEGDGLPALQKVVGGYIELAFQVKSDVLYVDEEGLLKGYRFGFTYEGAPQRVYVGSAVVSGVTRGGAIKDCTLTVEQVKEKVRFVG